MIGFTITQDEPGKIAYNTLLTLQIALDFGQNVRLSPKLATLLSRRAGNDVKMIAPEVWRNMSKGETMLCAMPLLDALLHNGLLSSKRGQADSLPPRWGLFEEHQAR